MTTAGRAEQPSEPEPESEPESVTEPEAVDVPESVDEPESVTVTGPGPEAVDVPESVTVTGPEAVDVPESVTVTVTEAVAVNVLRRPSATGVDAKVVPKAVLLHGITDAAVCWEAVAAELDPRYEVVMPDARGHGATPLTDEPITVETLAADAVRVLEVEGPAVLLGHSMGASTAVVVAARRPDLVRGLVLEDPVWRDVAPGTDEFDFAAWIREMQSLDHAGRVAAGRAGDPHWSETELEGWAVSKAQVDLRFFDRMDLGTVASTWPLLRELTVPTLLITGDVERGAIVSTERGRAAIERLPGLDVLHLDGAGHSIHRDQLGRYVRAVNDFLDRMLP